jgi:hypothetical protein
MEHVDCGTKISLKIRSYLEIEIGSVLENDGARVQQPRELFGVVCVEGETRELTLVPEPLEDVDALLQVPLHLLFALGRVLGVVLQLEPEKIKKSEQENGRRRLLGKKNKSSLLDILSSLPSRVR